MIAQADIARDLRRVYNQLGEEPTEEQYNEHGQYSAYTIRERFESLSAARKAAGLSAGVEKGVTKDTIAEDIRRVADIVDRPPSQKQYRKHGSYSVRTVHNKFESWIVAREYSGLSGGPVKQTRQSERDLLDAITELANRIGTVPTQEDMNREGKFSEEVYRRRFGSWQEAVRQAGFEPRARGAQPGSENPAWIDGGVEGYYGPNWESQRQKCLNRDEHQCQHCGMGQEKHLEVYGEELNIHHIINRRKFIEHGEFDYERANRLENLVALCTKHHKEIYDHSGGLQPHNVLTEVV